MSTMKYLKSQTWEVHTRLEKRLAIKDRFSDIVSYREHLSRILAFHQAAETEWAFWLERALGDFPARRKVPSLLRDLDDVGGSPIGIAEVPSVIDIPSALGAFYVLEGATLGGQHLLPMAEAKLGLSAENGASYLNSYGSDVRTMWTAFGAAVEAQCHTDDARDMAAISARSTFLAMEAWLCGDQS